MAQASRLRIRIAAIFASCVADPQRNTALRIMSYRNLLALLGIVLGCDFLILAIAHWRSAHRAFGKRPDGSLPVWSWLLFFPLLIYTLAVWHLLRLVTREPAQSSITKDLVVGRRLLASEFNDEFDNYIDLTAEFSEPPRIRRSPAYRSFPILDGAAPTPEALWQAVAGLKQGRTYVHCAQGHGRTGLFALAVLLDSGAVRTIEDGLRMLTAIRPGIRLNRAQYRCIQDYAENACRSAEAKT